MSQGREEISSFTDQARWLFEYHDSRSESLCTRAVALIGFVGVILALLLGSGLPDALKVTCQIGAAFVVTLALLLATSGCCLAVLATREMHVPGVPLLRSNWREWILRKRRDSTAKDIAETFLRAKDLTQKSALDWVSQTASARAIWFGRAVWLMFFSLVSLSAMMLMVGTQLYL